MKRFSIFVVASLLGGLSFSGRDALAYHEVSASVEITAAADFHEPLAAHGAWIEVESYGRCWHPARVEAHWRPYCYGYWVWTDCGWYWVSDEPWAWACYHYGRWSTIRGTRGSGCPESSGDLPGFVGGEAEDTLAGHPCRRTLTSEAVSSWMCTCTRRCLCLWTLTDSTNA